VLLILQHQAHSRYRPTATDEKTRKVFSVLDVISLVGAISGKSLKLFLLDVIFQSQDAPDPWRELTALPQAPDWISGPTSKGTEGRRREGGKERKETA